MMHIARFATILALLAACLLWTSCRGSAVDDDSSTSEAVTEASSGDTASSGDSSAEEFLRQASEAQELRAQKNEAVVNNLLETARRYRDRGELQKAWDSTLRALEVDATNGEARTMYNEIGRLLGHTEQTTEDIKRVLSDRYRVAQEAQRAEAERRYTRGVELMEENEYDAAIREFEGVLAIAKWNPYKDISYDELKSETEAKLAQAQAGKREADAAREDALAREIYEDLQDQEERVQARKAERIRTLLEEGFDRFERGEYDAAMGLANSVLDMEPNHAAALDLLESSREARHGKIAEDLLKNKREAYVSWLESVREAKIPQSEVLRWGDRKYWDAIVLKRKGAEVGMALDEDSPEVASIKNRLANQRVNLDFDDAPLDAVIDYLRSITNINMVIDPEVKTELEASGTTVNLTLNDIPVGTALRVLLDREEDLTYKFSDDVLLITRRSKAVGRVIPKFHDIRDISFGLTSFTGPEIKLTTGEEESDEPIPAFGSSEAKEAEISLDDITELVRNNIGVDTWDNNPGSIDISSGQLLVVHTAEIQREVAKFLNDLRKHRGVSVTVEARFLTVRDNYLQDVGVDFRGLGGESGTLADLDDVTNGFEDNASAGLDNSGAGLPAAAGGNPSSGIFFDDGGDGDYRGRTENIFDRSLGNMLTGNGGLSLQIAYLNDLELNAVLRAVEKTDKATLMTAPILTAYDTQKSSIHMINQIAYIEDYEVEVAQTAFIADPVVGIIQDGIVFDVRPTVSNDRKYVTIDLMPTVASLKKPIPTFTTNLGGLTFPVTIELPELTISKAGTTVMVPDGGTVVIGGLKQITSIDRKSETPFFSEIPLVGFFFSRKGKSEEIEDLILIVTVTINDMIEAEAALGKR